MMGMNTQTVVSAAVRTGRPTSRAPSLAAVETSTPSSYRFRKMFSRVTTAGSTSMPTATIRPIIEMRLSVMLEPKTCLSTYIIMNTQRAEIGIAEPMMTVLRKLRRKMKMTLTASSPPMSADWQRVPIPLRTSPDRSRMIFAFSLSRPTSSRMEAISFLIASAVATRFAVEAFRISMETALRPSSRRKDFLSGKS